MATFDMNSAIINRFLRLTEVDLETNQVNWLLRNVANPSAEFTGESVDKTDERGILISRFDTAKGFVLSGESSKLELGLMASQLGTKVEVADTTHKIKGEDFEIIKVAVEDTSPSEKYTVTPAYKPLTAPDYVYILNKGKSLSSQKIEIDTSDAEGKAVYDATTGKITLPDSFDKTVAYVGVLYEYETEDAVRVSDSSENFNKNAKYIAKLLVEDVCGISCACTIVIPKGKIDNNFTINLTTEGNHPFSITAMKDYCSEEEQLCYVLFGKNVGTTV